VRDGVESLLGLLPEAAAQNERRALINCAQAAQASWHGMECMLVVVLGARIAKLIRN